MQAILAERSIVRATLAGIPKRDRDDVEAEVFLAAWRAVKRDTMDDPFVKRALLEEDLTGPRDIVLGESSLDEMRIGLFNGFVKN
ncbi:hypothetical protein [Sorangium sp. So ce861]|uniref:hypothetical protein n=1 Tax=Sorangium sp. So ce861 TaxID=3133323 RepID=UPI003F62F33F